MRFNLVSGKLPWRSKF